MTTRITRDGVVIDLPDSDPAAVAIRDQQALDAANRGAKIDARNTVASKLENSGADVRALLEVLIDLGAVNAAARQAFEAKKKDILDDARS